MEKKVLKEPMFFKEIAALIRFGEAKKVTAKRKQNYHENDFAQRPEDLTKEKRGLMAEADLREPAFESMKKRLPWLMILLFFGMGVSSVVGAFESVVAALPIVICFQSLILDMAGNVGTQSLAVTIRVLMEEEMCRKEKTALVMKEMKVGCGNGILLGILTFFSLGVYIAVFKDYGTTEAFLIAGCVGTSLFVSMMISSLVGTLIPMFFHKIKLDPAVASGPLITTMNDLAAVLTYYGLAWIFLIKILHIV